ncbi:type II toxin-antitoxin system RatA family toxin [Phyllobacterium zundukense]|uniref:Ubiquinone-binding protein n=1 Tax=Phyllobacterium zundukense TaxID=1867719 RepID=A0A2N9W1F6_9HYPH|nr:type II toxin-antitoxin system RatA family toxin [Phyllobacterium zundukense]ATU91653.1 ubiquinone-binding protein [Phyllobacterium zundukense]PIO45574.1 ubiquinone-binding protein [Phyllobacterium zundukense]
MPKFETIRPVVHRAEQMFDLVADVESYPQFLPMCESLKVRSRKESHGKTLLIADMTVGYKLIRETFTSQVLLKPEEKVILTKYIDGPFRYLDNRWQFVPDVNPEHSTVKFYIDYEFKSRTLGFLMGSMFDIAFRKFTEAFEKRADAIYGKGEKSPVV